MTNFLDQKFMGATGQDLVQAAIGGLLLSLASSIHLWAKGRVTGMSGVLNGLVTLESTTFFWKSSLFLAMVATSSVALLYFNDSGIRYETLLVFRYDLSVYGFILAGLLVGIGTKLGNGCTSGHGVCGLPRFSKRSIAAVAIFMIFSLITANTIYQLQQQGYTGAFTESSNLKQPIDASNYKQSLQIILISCIVLWLITLVYHKIKFGPASKLGDCFIAFIVGIIFACGLIISKMHFRHVVLGFLTIQSNWNPSLGVVLLFAVVPNIFTFKMILGEEKPLFASNFSVPLSSLIDKKLIVGSSLFGIGWGIGGICPGPAFVMIPTLYSELIFAFLVALMLGSLLTSLYQEKRVSSLKEEGLMSDRP